MSEHLPFSILQRHTSSSLFQCCVLTMLFGVAKCWFALGGKIEGCWASDFFVYFL